MTNCGCVFKDCGGEDLTNKCSAYKKIVSRIANSCMEQKVIVTVIVVSVKCEQWHKSGENKIKSLTVTEHIFVFTWFAINELSCLKN